MSNNDLNELENTLHEYGISIETIEKLYPKLYEPVMNLSITGVPARLYYYWKTEGLIDGNAVKETKKTRVKINLIEYVWIKVIVVMRQFGVPFKKIKKAKELMFSDIISTLTKEKDEYIAFLRESSKVSEKKIKAVEMALELAQKEIGNSPEEYSIYHTLLGNLILDLLLKNDKGYITLSKEEKEYNVGYFSLKTMSDFQAYVQPLFDAPCLC